MERLEQVSPSFGAQDLVAVYQKGEKTTILYNSDHAEGKNALWKTVIEPFEENKTEKIGGIDGASDPVVVSDKFYVLSNGTVTKLNLESNKADAIATKLGVQLRPMLASDPSAHLYYTRPANLQYDFRTELVKALNHGLASVGCRTHSVRLSDHTDEYMALYNQYWSQDIYGDKEDVYTKMKNLEDPTATLVWKKKDAFASDTPSPAVYEALTDFFIKYLGHPVTSHVKLAETISVAVLDAEKWEPMAQTQHVAGNAVPRRTKFSRLAGHVGNHLRFHRFTA